MGKVKRLFVCGSCQRPSAQWSGKCAACGGWGTVNEHPVGSASRSRAGSAVSPAVLTLAPEPEEHRIFTGFANVDRVLGGGLVPGSVVLLAGAPGIGKSTLLLQLASRLAAAGHPCLVASGEESRRQVAGRANRLGIEGEGIDYVSGRDLFEVLDAARARRPAVLIVDSIQSIRDQESDALPGGVAQVRTCADALISLAKEHDVTVLLVGHVTKEGDLAGPRTLEHAVDAVLIFEGDHRSGLRILAGGKNRFGPEGEVASFEMTAAGLIQTEAGARIGDGRLEPGCATSLALAGRRAFAVDVQALVVSSDGPPRRQVSGLDPRRFHIVAAVVDRALQLGLTRCELYGASSGGFRLDDPGTDLAVAAALASAGTGAPPPPGTGFVGEVSLSGLLRPAPGLEYRLSAALAAGLETVVVPTGGLPTERSARGPRVIEARHLREALAWVRGRAWAESPGSAPVPPRRARPGKPASSSGRPPHAGSMTIMATGSVQP
jgi:DNA repair protein RadA/Sms